ncbi:hypothetical protein ABXV18_24480 [Vibrio owensii]|uniref:hypothetical protein n=1 Tax=Vibrio owensii TaxID=696485 RepID=UPI00339864C3
MKKLTKLKCFYGLQVFFFIDAIVVREMGSISLLISGFFLTFFAYEFARLKTLEWAENYYGKKISEAHKVIDAVEKQNRETIRDLKLLKQKISELE